jgi:hypothetical protein
MPGPRNMIPSALFCALVMAVAARADTLPASVRACIGEADPGRRLTCYDREIARVIAPPDTFAPVATAPTGAAPAVANSSLRDAPPPAAPARHLVGKVSAVRQSGDNLIVTLDNGDVWEQSAPATSQLNLRPGDTVKLDREMASWFLSNRYGDNIQVRLRHP